MGSISRARERVTILAGFVLPFSCQRLDSSIAFSFHVKARCCFAGNQHLDRESIAVHGTYDLAMLIDVAEFQRSAAVRTMVMNEIEFVVVRQQEVFKPAACNGGQITTNSCAGALAHSQPRPIEPDGNVTKAAGLVSQPMPPICSFCDSPMASGAAHIPDGSMLLGNP